MRSFAISSAVALSACLLAPTAGEAALLSVTPSSSIVNVGDTAAFDVVVEDVTSLVYIEFNLDFDSTILSPDQSALAFGDFLTSAGAFSMFTLFDPTFDPDTIYVRVRMNTASSTASGVPRTVLSTSFNTLATGVSPITIAGVLLIDGDNFHNYMIGERYNSIATEVNNGSVDVVTPTAAVPEPSTIVLTLTGLAASWWKRRRARA